jgi:predicted dehydrogenase
MAPITQAAEMCRQRGRIVLIGVCGLELNRNQFFKKELTFQVSSSYGPGRYDAEYEQRGHDYPFGFVRWTAQRNFEAVLSSMRGHRLDVRPLVTDRVAHAEVATAYRRLLDRDSLGIVMEYGAAAPLATRTALAGAPVPVRGTDRVVRAGFIGAGAFTRAVLLPALTSAGVELRGVASRNGLSAAHVGRKFKFAFAASDADAVIDDPDTDAVFIITPHDTHAALVCRALAAGKHVFVEKPLCISDAELEDVRSAYAEHAVPAGLQLMVGFNRRFSPLSRTLSSLLQPVTTPKAMVFTVNAGSIAAGHWVGNAAISGGRIVGEGVHFIDLLSYLAGSPITAVQASSAGARDQMTLTLRFADGSTGTVHYFTSGHRSFPKEQVTVFADGVVYVLDDFRSLRAHGARKFRSQRLWNQDKGHAAELQAFVRTVREGGAPAIPFAEIVNATRASLAAVRAADSGLLEAVPPA